MNLKTLLVAALLATGAFAPSAFAQNDASSVAIPNSSYSGGLVPDRKAMKAADRKLARAVRHVIEHAKGLDATRIAIITRNGNVTLTGSVPESSQIDVAVQQAKSVPGVTAIVNRLVVGEIAP